MARAYTGCLYRPVLRHVGVARVLAEPVSKRGISDGGGDGAAAINTISLRRGSESASKNELATIFFPSTYLDGPARVMPLLADHLAGRYFVQPGMRIQYWVCETICGSM